MEHVQNPRFLVAILALIGVFAGLRDYLLRGQVTPAARA